ncbi:cold shock domain-containing protein [Streptomyces sp. NPDC048483]|uniref:cold-shock protein n=1 Tax=Streptomyces sp. NPDC048483 TaxID=3154927 RepID=UPI00344766BB
MEFRVNGGVVVATGKVIRFDAVRGYGFVAPENGGGDVFLHVNDLLVEKSLMAPGAVVEFEVEEGDRGPKAADVRLVEGAVRTAPVASFSLAQSPSQESVEDGVCDVLSAREFTQEVTETLLAAAPGLTAEQILQIRRSLAEVATKHGWVEA